MLGPGPRSIREGGESSPTASCVISFFSRVLGLVQYTRNAVVPASCGAQGSCYTPSMSSSPEPLPPGPPESIPERVVLNRPGFSPVVTFLAGLVLLAALGFFAYLQVTVPRLLRVSFPESALTLMVSRNMEVEEALAIGTAWERTLYPLFLGTTENDLNQAITWFQELATYHTIHQVLPEIQSRVQLRLAILEAEAGLVNSVRTRVDGWSHWPDPYPALGRLVAAAYWDSITGDSLFPTPPPRTVQELLTVLEGHLLPGWFHDRLVWNLAKRTGDAALLNSVQQSMAARARPLLQQIRWIIGIELVLLVIGASMLILFLRNRAESFQTVAAAQIPPPWRGREGAAVLIRGGATAGVVAILILFFGGGHVFIRVFALPIASLPLLFLTRQHLLRPAGLDFRAGFGLWPRSGRWVPFGLAAGAVFGAGLLGGWGLELGAQALSLSTHWTESFDEDLVWGSASVVGICLVGYIAVAPVFEEVVFRGLLFGTLRRRYGCEAAALLSGGLFALAHGYGWFGFTSVCWSGVLWAWAYEKTGSLLPGIVAHALNNLIVSLSIMWLLRGSWS